MHKGQVHNDFGLMMFLCFFPFFKKSAMHPILFLLVSLSFLFRCASMQAPSGGEEDKTPPSILKLEPAHAESKVDTNAALHIRWSEWMDRPSVERGFFINPSNSGTPRFKWSGSSVTVSFDSSFQKNTTYLISMASSVCDLHGVHIDKPISWAFSTGDSLATGRISGRISSFSSRTLVYTYRIPQNDTTFLMSRRKPDYVISPSKEGIFHFAYMNPGLYRIFAFEDQDGDHQFEMGKDPIAIPAYDCKTQTDTAQAQENIVLQIHPFDTTSFGVVTAQAQNARTITCMFNKGVPAPSLEQIRFFTIVSLSDSTKDSLKVINISQGQNKSELVLISDYQKQGKQYKLSIQKLMDADGNTIRSGSDTVLFYSNIARDTLAPKISSVYPSASDPLVLPGDSICIFFNKPINARFFQMKFRLADSLGKSVDCNFRDCGMMQIQIFPSREMEGNQLYRIRVLPGALSDIFRNTNRDTLKYEFHVLAKDEFTRTISGRITGNLTQTTILGWKHLASQREFFFKTKGNQYTIERIPEGKYLFYGFLDKNQNNRYDKGKLFPFEFSENLAMFPDTVSLRGLFEADGLDLHFNQ